MKPFSKGQGETFNRLEKEFLEYERVLENDRFNKILSELPPERRAHASLNTQGFHAGGEKPAEFHTSDIESINSYSVVKNHLSNSPDSMNERHQAQMDEIEKNFRDLSEYRHKQAFYSFIKERADYLTKNLGLDAEQKESMLSTAGALDQIYTDNINRIEASNKQTLNMLPKPPPEAMPDYVLKPPEVTFDNPLSIQAQKSEAVFSFYTPASEMYMNPAWQPQMGQMGQTQMGQMGQPQMGQPVMDDASLGTFAGFHDTLANNGALNVINILINAGIIPPEVGKLIAALVGGSLGSALNQGEPQMYQQQMYQQPIYQQPIYQQPIYQQPIYQQPMYQQQMYQQPMYQQPMYQQPMQPQPMQPQPMQPQPMQPKPMQPQSQPQPKPQPQFTVGNDEARRMQSDLINQAMNIESKEAIANDMKAFFGNAQSSDFSPEKTSGLKGLENPDTRLGMARAFMLSKGMGFDEIHSQSREAMVKKTQIGRELDGILKSGDSVKIGKMYSDMSDALLRDEFSTFYVNLNDRSTYPKEYGKWHMLSQSAKMFNDTLGVNMNNADDVNNVINKDDKNLSAYFEMAKNEEFAQRLKGIDALNKTVGPFYEMMSSGNFSSANSDKLNKLSDNFRAFDTAIKEKRKTGEAKSYAMARYSERTVANDMAKEMQGSITSEKAFDLDMDFAPKQESLSKSYDSIAKSNAPKQAEAKLLDDMPAPDIKPVGKPMDADDIFNEASDKPRPKEPEKPEKPEEEHQINWDDYVIIENEQKKPVSLDDLAKESAKEDPDKEFNELVEEFEKDYKSKPQNEKVSREEKKYDKMYQKAMVKGADVLNKNIAEIKTETMELGKEMEEISKLYDDKTKEFKAAGKSEKDLKNIIKEQVGDVTKIQNERAVKHKEFEQQRKEIDEKYDKPVVPKNKQSDGQSKKTGELNVIPNGQNKKPDAPVKQQGRAK